MTHRYIKIGVTGVVLVLAFSALLWSTLREGTEYYKNVNEISEPQQWQGKKLQLHGYVVPGTWVQKPNTLEYRFKIQNDPPRAAGVPGKVIEASYTGILPDTFKDEAEVVLKGRLSPDGFQVEPNGVMAKCPSKYQAADKAARAGS